MTAPNPVAANYEEAFAVAVFALLCLLAVMSLADYLLDYWKNAR